MAKKFSWNFFARHTTHARASEEEAIKSSKLLLLLLLLLLHWPLLLARSTKFYLNCILLQRAERMKESDQIMMICLAIIMIYP